LRLTAIGEIARKYWTDIPGHYPNVRMDEFVIMPDHMHGIMQFRTRSGKMNVVGVQNFEPLRNVNTQSSTTQCPKRHAFQHTLPDSVGSIIRAYKSAVTMWCRRNGFPQFKWQRSFYDHIVRDVQSLFQIRQYIRNNPADWLGDAENHLKNEEYKWR